jgi:hypothetical protein
MESLGMGICGGCLANVPVFRNPYGPIAQCLRCLDYDRARVSYTDNNIAMYRNSRQLPIYRRKKG